MRIYRMEDYRILYRSLAAMETGTYEITRIGTRRAVMKYVETYKTNAGEFTRTQWRDILLRCMGESGSRPLLDRIAEYCKTHCVWLKKKEREDYALDILAGRIYRYWEDFSPEGVSENTVFVFVFSDQEM